jgi:histidinol-phosphate aminotransferase
VRRLHAGLPKSVLLVIDAAYAEYVSRNDYESGVELVDQAENVVMTRTFSKIYGMGGLRLGWMYGPGRHHRRHEPLRQPFNVNLAAQIAGIAALEDIAHTDASRTNNDIWLPWLVAELRQARPEAAAQRRQLPDRRLRLQGTRRRRQRPG